MIGGIWRWLWTAGVFGVFVVVVGAALDGAPPADGELPLIEPDERPIKERVALAEIDAVVPRSSVLDLLAEGDDPETAAAEALPRLERALAGERDADATTVELEAADAAADAGDGEPTTEPSTDQPAEVVAPEPASVPPAAETAAPRETEPAAVAARTGTEAFRIQLAAVPPGEEQATFARLERRFADVLGALTPRFQAVSTDAGVLVRVQAGGFATEAAAAAQCERIRAAGGECFVVGAPG